MQVTEPRTVTFQNTYYICDRCCEDLTVGWKGNRCMLCDGNFCNNLECIETIDLPGKGKVFCCRYCCSVGGDIILELADLESERLRRMQLWRARSPSPALKKEPEK